MDASLSAKRKKVLGDTIDEGHDLLLRQLPITDLIYEASRELKVHDALIRAKLVECLGLRQSRESQIENQKFGSLRKKHIDSINDFFTQILERPVDITATVSAVGEGLFSALTV